MAKDGKLLGMGSGQPNRVKSVQIALEKAKEEAKVGYYVMLCSLQYSTVLYYVYYFHRKQLAPLRVQCWHPTPSTPGKDPLCPQHSALLPLLQGAVLASDAFFPFSWNDSVEIACQAGVGAIVHPGGSVRDQDAIECCNKVSAGASWLVLSLSFCSLPALFGGSVRDQDAIKCCSKVGR